MKKLFTFSWLLAFTLSFCVLSCKKKNNDTSNVIDVTSKPSLNRLFSGLRYTPQALRIEAGRDTIVFGSQGTMFHFYSNSFKNLAGSIITNGFIDLKLIEMYKPGDMICNRASTGSNGSLLKSGGQVSVDATMNGEKVFARAYGIGFIQSAPSSQVMLLFSGNLNNGDSVVNWAVSDSTKFGNVAIGADTARDTSVSQVYGRPFVGFVFDSASSLEYTNCDAFYSNDSQLTSVSIILPDTSFNPSNTQLFLVLPSINCAMSTVEPFLGGNSWDPSSKTMKLVSETRTNIIPAGMNYELVVMTVKNGQYYFYKESGTIPHNGLLSTVTMNPQTESYVKAQLIGL